MNVKTLCLSILYEADATGYEIRRMSVEGECSYFVEASYGSIYPALARLEAEELVTSRIEPQEGKPARKIYSITEAGRRAFVSALFEPLDEDVFRSPFLLFLRFAQLLPAGLVEARLNERLAQMDERKKQLEDLLEQRGDHAADAWIIRYGLSCFEVARNHLQTHMNELVALARPEGASKEAAE